MASIGLIAATLKREREREEKGEGKHTVKTREKTAQTIAETKLNRLS